MTIQEWVERWPTSSMNGENPNAVTIASVSRALREQREQSRLLEQTDRFRDSELSRKTDMNI
jgi:hypothetical protein